MEFTQQQQSALTNSNMEEDAFNRSINSKLSDWTSVFDSNVELSPYKFCWSPARSNGSASPNLKRSRDSLLSESVVYENVVKVREQLRELFDESFNQLCNEIQKSFDSWEFGQEVYLNDLLEREALLRAHAEQLAEVAPEMSELIGLKLSSLSRSMEQLRLKHDADAKLNQSDRSAVTHLRKWLQTTEFKLVQIKQDVSLAVLDINELQSLRVKLQVVQLEIETDGKQLIQFAKRYFAKKALEWTTDSRRIQRLKRNLEALETRWYNLLLATVETLEQLNNYIERSPSGDDNSDIESVSSAEPLRKRCRHSFDQDQYDQKPEDYEDTIPFSASEYEPYMSSSGEEHGSDVEYENHRGQIVANRSAMVSADDSLLDKTPTELVHRTSSAEDGWSSSGKTHDVGYSSGENSVHEALNSIGKESPVTEATQTDSSDLHRMRTQTSPVNSYYRTVPLDDFGTTDTETPRFAPVPSLNLIEDSDHGNQVLTESMVVHASEQSDDSVSHNPEKDYKEIMKIIDENSIRMGTSWKELKSASNRRLSATPSKCNSVGRMSNRRSLPTAGKMSCDASSEDSDYNTGPLLPAQLSVSFNGKPSNLLTVPPVNSHSQPQMMQRKRRFQRQAPNSASKLATSLNNSILKNLTMEQSVYEPMICNESNEDELMSQSLNLPSLSGKCLDSRKRLIRRRMRRTASDNTDLNFYVGNLTPNIQPETKRQVERRNSMESNSSSTTFHDSGDAHFEWDEYREEPLAEDVQMAPNTDLSMSKHSKVSIMPILTAPDVDEDFQNELAFVDVHNNMGVNDFLSQSRESLGESYRLLQSQQGSDDALRLNAISVGRIAMDNLRRIRAIMRSSTVLDMQCLDAFEKLHAEWLELIGKHKIPAHDTLSAQEVSDVLKLFRRIREYYLLFGQTCGQPDSEFIKSATVDELKTRLNLRKESFIELQKLHEKMASTVRQFSELQPDLDRVTANINLLSRSVANLDCFYQISGLRQSLKNLYKRLDEVTTVVNRLSNGTNSTHISDHKVENQLRRIDSELTDCQNRMSSLETACNNIISWLNKNNNDLGVDEDEVECMKKIIQQFGETKSEVIGMRTRFDSLLKSHCPDLLCRPSSQLNEDSYSDSSVSKFSTSELKLRRRRHSSEAESVDLQTTSNGKVASSRNNSASSQTTTAIQQSSTLKTLFSCMILIGMGIFILYMTADDELFSRSGHWRFKFGPQLKYVNGPPPF